MATSRPLMRAIGFDDVLHAVERLLPIAQSDTHQSARVADFLLAWWNGSDCGKFELTHLCNVDSEISEDMLIIMGFLAQNGVHYADAWGHRESMIKLWEQWRELPEPESESERAA